MQFHNRSICFNQSQARISNSDLSMEIPMGEEIYIIYCDQKVAQECYFATGKEVEKAKDFA